MRAATIVNGSLVIADRPTPVAGPGDVLVEIASAGINAADLLQLLGFYPAPEGSPADIPGLEVAGHVVAVGAQVDADLLGRRVCAVVGGGAHATHVVVPAEHLIHIPDEVDLITAGGFAEAFSTAADALITQGELASGQHLVVSGAAGGVGTAAVQIAATLGARVTAVTRDDTHHAALQKLGAHTTTSNSPEMSLAPVDVLLELIGAAHLEVAQRFLAPRGRVVIIGVGGGGRAEIDLLAIMQRRIRVTGSTLRARPRDQKAEVATLVNEVVRPWWQSGQVHVPVAQVVDFSQINDAYEHFRVAGKLGKIIVRM
jgi:NADPH:quinone reductase-like Zn-dependent oxidoreductase